MSRLALSLLVLAALATAMPSGQAPAPVASWSLSGPLIVPRYTDAVMLEDGRILFPGSDDFRRDAELYDPFSGTSSFTGSLSVGRCYGCSALRLNDGRVLVAGGWTGGPVEYSAEIYDPATGTFSPAANLMSSPRIGATINMLPDGRVLVANGHPGRGINSTADIFNPATDSFAFAGHTAVPRLGVSVTLTDGRVLLVGGMTGSGAYLASAEIYDPATGTFSLTGSMSEGRHGHQAVRLADGRVLVTGGSANGGQPLASAEVYDPATGTFSTVSPMLSARHAQSMLRLANGQVIVIGGVGAAGAMLASTEWFDPQTGMFSPGPDLTAPRSSGFALALPDGRGLLAGGFETWTARTSRVEILVAETPDVTPPVISSVTPSRAVLWPPNHKMVAVRITVSASDDSGVPACSITGVLSNERANGLSDGNTTADWEVTGPLTVSLRAERSGWGEGRVYTINVTCSDPSNNRSTATTRVSVGR